MTIFSLIIAIYYVYFSFYRFFNKIDILKNLNITQKNYDLLRETFTHDSLFSRFVSVVSHLDSDELIADAEEFFAERDTKGYEKSLSQCVLNLSLS